MMMDGMHAFTLFRKIMQYLICLSATVHDLDVLESQLFFPLKVWCIKGGACKFQEKWKKPVKAFSNIEKFIIEKIYKFVLSFRCQRCSSKVQLNSTTSTGKLSYLKTIQSSRKYLLQMFHRGWFWIFYDYVKNEDYSPSNAVTEWRQKAKAR